MDTMETTVNRNLLRFAVGRAMMCGCGSVLDVRSAVSLRIGQTPIVACGSCVDRARAIDPAGWDSVAAEVLDGRELFARKGRK